MQNGYCERFNGSFRYEVLNAYCFNSLAHMRAIVDQWIHEYNYERPHNRLGGLTPIAYEQKTLQNFTL